MDSEASTGDDRSRPLPPDGGTARSLRFRIAVQSSVSISACGPESGIGISSLRQTTKGDFHRQRLILPIHTVPGCPSQIVFQCGNRESAPRPQTACLRKADCLPTHFRQVDSFVAVDSITKGILRMILNYPTYGVGYFTKVARQSRRVFCFNLVRGIAIRSQGFCTSRLAASWQRHCSLPFCKNQRIWGVPDPIRAAAPPAVQLQTVRSTAFFLLKSEKMGNFLRACRRKRQFRWLSANRRRGSPARAPLAQLRQAS